MALVFTSIIAPPSKTSVIGTPSTQYATSPERPPLKCPWTNPACSSKISDTSVTGRLLIISELMIAVEAVKSLVIKGRVAMTFTSSADMTS